MRADKIRGPIYEFGEFRLDTAERVIESAGQPLSITPKALDVLIVLIENRGRIVEKEDLMSRVWPQVFVEENNLAFNISVLRKLLGENPGAPRFIETVPKRGYRFIANVVEVSGSGSPGAEALKESLPIPPSRQGAKRPRLAWSWVSAAALLSLAVAGIIALRSHRTPKLTDKSTIVLADFVNKTGDPVFDGTLDRGLAVQLEQSPLFSILPDERIRTTLRLMGQPADARLTPALARGICERTGSTVVLEGSIARLGSQYVIGLRARNCTTGEIVDDDQVKAARKEEVLDALSQIARNFRFRVGESPTTLKTHDTPLAEATTPSLEALKVYSAGLKVHFSSGAAAALPLFKRAVEIDPKFAMAYAYLGRAYANLDESELAAENIKQAWQLRDRVSDRERFAIDTRYQALVTGNQEELRQTSEAWVQAYPRDPQPSHGIVHLLRLHRSTRESCG